MSTSTSSSMLPMPDCERRQEPILQYSQLDTTPYESLVVYENQRTVDGPYQYLENVDPESRRAATREFIAEMDKVIGTENDGSASEVMVHQQDSCLKELEELAGRKGAQG